MANDPRDPGRNQPARTSTTGDNHPRPTSDQANADMAPQVGKPHSDGTVKAATKPAEHPEPLPGQVVGPATGAARITFLGGDGAGNVGSTTMGSGPTGTIDFPLNEAVLVDPSKGKGKPEQAFLQHVINKAKNNRFFKVEDAAGDDKSRPAQVHQREPTERQVANPKRGRAN